MVTLFGYYHIKQQTDKKRIRRIFFFEYLFPVGNFIKKFLLSKNRRLNRKQKRQKRNQKKKKQKETNPEDRRICSYRFRGPK